MNLELNERTNKQIIEQQIGIFIQKLKEEKERLEKSYRKLLIISYILKVLLILVGFSICYFLYKIIEPLLK